MYTDTNPISNWLIMMFIWMLISSHRQNQHYLISKLNETLPL